jgi:hypothetical protein
MKAYLDALTAVNVLTANQAEWQETVTYYNLNTGFQIKVEHEGYPHLVDEFEFDSDTDEVTVKTFTQDEDFDAWYLELTAVTPDQLIIERVTRVTLEELQG